MSWLSAQSSELTQLYRDSPLLYDCCLLDDKEKNLQQDALMEIAITCSIILIERFYEISTKNVIFIQTKFINNVLILTHSFRIYFRQNHMQSGGMAVNGGGCPELKNQHFSQILIYRHSNWILI